MRSDPYIQEYNANPAEISDRALTDYTKHLKRHNLDYQVVDYYLQVGQITLVQGWLLDISIVISQINDLFTTILPPLIEKNITFRIPKDKDTALSILAGELGYTQTAKIVTVYPGNITQLIELSKTLIELTRNMKGPSVPTDAHLGGNVFTRYGGFNPIIATDETGKKINFIYNHSGSLTEDIPTIPFSIPKGITWPFDEIKPQPTIKTKTIFNRIYKPIKYLKTDARGYVIKGIYFKPPLNICNCLIKVGKINTWSDEHGRDICDRLVWQNDLHNSLKSDIPLPEIIDCFVEDGDRYLIMEFIKGKTLYDYFHQINKLCKTWLELTASERILLLNHLITISNIINVLHKKGYVHRDITPVNFIINKNKVTLIDIELMYSLIERKPFPPFTYGTPGFMSPEQILVNEPTIKEDIYGIAALIIEILVGISPTKFYIHNTSVLAGNLSFFIDDMDLSKTIANSLSPTFDQRPDMDTILNHLTRHKTNSLSLDSYKSSIRHKYLPEETIKKIIIASINGLSSSPTVLSNDLWFSKSIQENQADIDQKSYSIYPGIRNGIAGILYFLSLAAFEGFETSTCNQGIQKGWNFLSDNFLALLPDVPAGLYNGSAGIALALAAALKSGQVNNNDTNTNTIHKCLELPNTGLDLASGSAGQVLAILQCEDYMDPTIAGRLLKTHCTNLIQMQQKDGSWINSSDKNSEKNIGFAHGAAGICCALMEYGSRYSSKEAKLSAVKGLQWIEKMISTHILKRRSLLIQKENALPLDLNFSGVILALIRGYEISRDEHYKKLSEILLRRYPFHIINDNFSFGSGLSHLGEVYLEAYRAFNSLEWRDRSEWIAQVLTHTYVQQSMESSYWLADNNVVPTADFFTGNSGIIHFLIRSLSTTHLKYPFLP